VKKFLFFTVVIFVLLFAGCSKESPSVPQLIVVTASYTVTPTQTPTFTSTEIMSPTNTPTDTTTFTATPTHTATIDIAFNPQITPIGDINVVEAAYMSVSLSASGHSGQLLVFCKSQGPAWVTVAGSGTEPWPAAGVLMLSSPQGSTGTYPCAYRVIASGTCEAPGNYDEETLDVNIYANTAPVLSAPSVITMNAGGTNDSQVQVDDDPWQVISFEIYSGPSWAEISGDGINSAGTIYGDLHLAPGASDSGTYNVTVRVIDGGTFASPLSMTSIVITVVVVP